MSLKPDERAKVPCPFCGSGGHVFVIQRKADEFVANVVCVNNDCEASGPGVVMHTGRAAEFAAFAAWNRRP